MSRETTNPSAAEAAIASASGPVVVGYDGSQSAMIAVRYAARAAARRRVPLRIVTTFSVVVSDMGMGTGFTVDADVIDSLRAEAEHQVQGAAEVVRAEYPTLDVTALAIVGPAAATLLEQSRQAGLIVVGSSGKGALAGLLGSTSRAVASHSAAPTVVARVADPTGDTVVVGVDGSPDSLRALAFAFDVASRTGWKLRAVHTWDVPPIGALTGMPSPEPPELLVERAEFETRAALEEMTGFGDRYPDVAVEHVIVRGAAAKTLVEQSAGAALLVVGSRGRGGFLGLILGSVSQGVLQHAKCNVAVVRTAG